MLFRCVFISLLCTLVVSRSEAQVFLNGDLNGTVGISAQPTSWISIPFTDPVCQALSAIEATTDVVSATGPAQTSGIAGIPYSGTTFTSGLHCAAAPFALWHEGIQQTVSGFTIGTQYEISFYQTVVKQQNCLDTSGSWRVYVDTALIATTTPSISHLFYNDTALIWECRVVSFIATSTSHTFKFIPWDDDPVIETDFFDEAGGLRMGIDLINFSSSVVPEIDSIGPICINSQPVNLTASGSGGIWSGPGITAQFLGEFNPSVAGLGTHQIIYSVPFSCTSVISDTAYITVVNSVIAEWQEPSPLCISDPPILLDSFITGDTSGVWSGIGVTGNYFDPSSGSSFVTYTVSDSICSHDSSLVITVLPLDNPNFSYNKVDYCVSEQDPSANITGTSGGYFTINNGGTINLTNGTVDLDLSGVGSFTITYITNGPCPDSSSVSINIHDIPDATILPSGPYCVDHMPVVIFPVNAGGTWTASCAGCINSSGIFDPSVAGTGIHTVFYTLSGICSDTQSIQITVNPLAIADFSYLADPATQQVEFFNESINATDFIWYFGDGDSSTLVDPVHQYVEEPAQYTVCLIATNPDSCNAFYCSTVLVEADMLIYVPNSFTPNDDGLNDVFLASVIGYEPGSFTMQVFDRWGELVFVSEDVTKGWPGRINGQPAKSDVYVWQISVRGKSSIADQIYKGHVTLVR